MAIEITPQPKIKTPIWTITLLVVDFLLFTGLLTTYFYFESSSKKLTELLKKSPQEVFLEEQIKQKEIELTLDEERINTFGTLVSSHRNTVKLFDLLEKICLPDVWFSKFGFDYSQETVGVSGQTDNFVSLGQQIDILKKEPLFKNVSLTGVKLGKEGEVEFSLLLQFNPQVFQK